MEKLVKLFTPGKIGTMEVKNRIAFAPVGHGFTFGTKPDGFLTDRLLAFYEAQGQRRRRPHPANGGIAWETLRFTAYFRSGRFRHDDR